MNIIRFSDSGTVKVAAYQLGSSDYLPAPEVVQNVQVKKLAQMLSYFGPFDTQPYPPVKDTTSVPPIIWPPVANSGLPVTIAVQSGPLKVLISGYDYTQHPPDDYVFHDYFGYPTGVGAVTLVATQPGNAQYLPAKAITTSFLVAAAQKITFPIPADRVFSTTPFTVAVKASSDLPVTLEIVSGPATILGRTVTPTGPGVVTIRATQTGDANYAAAPPVVRTVTLTSPK